MWGWGKALADLLGGWICVCGGGGGRLGWRVNQWISTHPLMSAGVNKAFISCRHIRCFSSPLGSSWLAKTACRSQETHLRVYRHLWLVIGSPCEINGTVGATSQSGSSPVPTHTHTQTRTHYQQLQYAWTHEVCMLSKLTFAIKTLLV